MNGTRIETNLDEVMKAQQALNQVDLRSVPRAVRDEVKQARVSLTKVHDSLAAAAIQK